jgi:DNA-binding transcriptional LysR family regulator
VNRLKEIDWTDLRYVLAAARAKTLAGAARAMAVDHTTIGRRLTSLEDALDTALIVRGPQGLSLTDAGERVLPLLEEMERAALAVQSCVAAQKAPVKLAVPSAFSRILAPHLAAFQDDHPELSLELMGGRGLVDLKRGEADLALRWAPIDEDLVAKKVADVGWSLYASEAYLARRLPPADPRDLRGHDLLGFEAELGESPGAAWLEQNDDGARVILRSREVSDMIGACVAGAGLAVLPCLFAAQESALKRLTRESLGSSRVWLAYRREAPRSDGVKATIAFVGEVMRTYAGQMA